MNKHRVSMLGVLLAMTGTIAVPAWASFGLQERSGRTGPPQEAIDACKEMSEGITVEIVTPRGDTIKASCKQINGQLVAVPDRGIPGPGNGGPPQGGGNER